MYHGLTRNIVTYQGLTSNIVTYQGLTRNIVTHQGLIRDNVTYQGFTRNILTYHRLTRNVPMYHGLTRNTITYHLLSSVSFHDITSKLFVTYNGYTELCFVTYHGLTRMPFPLKHTLRTRKSPRQTQGRVVEPGRVTDVHVRSVASAVRQGQQIPVETLVRRRSRDVIVRTDSELEPTAVLDSHFDGYSDLLCEEIKRYIICKCANIHHSVLPLQNYNSC